MELRYFPGQHSQTECFYPTQEGGIEVSVHRNVCINGSVVNPRVSPCLLTFRSFRFGRELAAAKPLPPKFRPFVNKRRRLIAERIRGTNPEIRPRASKYNTEKSHTHTVQLRGARLQPKTGSTGSRCPTARTARHLKCILTVFKRRGITPNQVISLP